MSHNLSNAIAVKAQVVLALRWVPVRQDEPHLCQAGPHRRLPRAALPRAASGELASAAMISLYKFCRMFGTKPLPVSVESQRRSSQIGSAAFLEKKLIEIEARLRRGGAMLQ